MLGGIDANADRNVAELADIKVVDIAVARRITSRVLGPNTIQAPVPLRFTAGIG